VGLEGEVWVYREGCGFRGRGGGLEGGVEVKKNRPRKKIENMSSKTKKQRIIVLILQQNFHYLRACPK